MFNIHSISGRIFIGKIIGLIIGIIAMLLLPLANIDAFSLFGLGTLLMFVLMGATTGFMGIFDRHPALSFKMPWWLRGGLVGLFFTLMYVLLSYDSINIVMQSNLVSWMGLTSPFWALLDGIVAGMLMGYVETRFAGEGKDLPIS